MQALSMRVAALFAVAATLTLFAFVIATPRQQDPQIGATASAGDVQLVDDAGDAPDPATETTDSDDDDDTAALLQQEEDAQNQQQQDDEQAQQQEQQDLQNMIESEQEAEQQNEAAQQQAQLDEQLASQ
jgi:parvulin-like peptidyl-prolyl isomerase